eukprot:UN04535
MLYREADMFIICQPEIDFLTKKYKLDTHILRYFDAFSPKLNDHNLILYQYSNKVDSFNCKNLSIEIYFFSRYSFSSR